MPAPSPSQWSHGLSITVSVDILAKKRHINHFKRLYTKVNVLDKTNSIISGSELLLTTYWWKFVRYLQIEIFQKLVLTNDTHCLLRTCTRRFLKTSNCTRLIGSRNFIQSLKNSLMLIHFKLHLYDLLNKRVTFGVKIL